MTKQMRELLAQLSEHENKAREAITNGQAGEAEKVMADVRDIRARINALRELEEAEENAFENSRPKGEQQDREELANEYKNVFLKAVRNKRLSADEQSTINAYTKEFYNVMHEGGVVADPQGDVGIVVPQDVLTRINELIRQETNLAAYVRNEQVSTLSGSRVLEVGARHTPFAVIDEYANLQEIQGPQFQPVLYQVVKRGGYLPLTSELLADNDANLLEYVVRWLAQKVPATHNSLILPILDNIVAGDINTMDDVKALKNVTLDPAFANRGTWFTNQDGFNWLDTLVDGMGRYLLQDDITNAGGKMLLTRPVVVVENALWPSVVGADTRAPLVLGDLKEHIVHFQRKGYELASTREGGDAWRRDTLEMRALMRDDMVTWDVQAAVRGEIILP